MRTSLIILALAFLLIPFVREPARALGTPTIKLSATRLVVLSDGRDSTEVIAEVRDSTGSLVPDGTQVNFTTNIGVFPSGNVAQTRAGSARARLTSQQKGTATVTAAVVGRAETIEITFTDDPSDTFQGNTFAIMQGTGVLLYDAANKVIEAKGRPEVDNPKGFPGAHLSFRTIEVLADQIQLDCSTNAVRAQGNVSVRRGSHRLKCSRLFLPMMGGDGYAIAEVDDRIRPVKVKSSDLKLEVQPNGVAPKFFEMADLSEGKLVITAQQILLFPGQKLQFKRPRFYQEGQKLVSMPFYSLPLMSTELFTEQFLTVGTQGIGLELPYYYDLTPASTGIFYVRHGERSGRSISSTQPGWSLDLVQGYNSLGGSSRYTGQFGFTGITRSDWGFRWTHDQEFASDTRGTFFLDFPQHRSVYGSTNLTKQLGPVYMGLNLSGNRSLAGYLTNGFSGELYAETLAKRVGATGYMYALGGTTGYSQTRTGPYSFRSQTEDVHARFFSSPFKLDSSTTLQNNITLGNVWSNQGSSGPSMIASLTANRQFKNATLQLSYDYTRTPAFLLQEGNHRLSASFVANAASKWSVSLNGMLMLDAQSYSVLADLDYAVAPRWRLALSTSLQRFLAGQYRDYELSVGRSIGGRELVFSYSTFNHRIYFDIEASRF